MLFEGGLASSAFRPPTNVTTRTYSKSPPRWPVSLPHALIFRGELCAAFWGRSLRAKPSLASGVQRGLLRKAFQDSCGLRLGGLGSGSRCAGCCVSAAASGREARAEPAGGGATAAAAHLYFSNRTKIKEALFCIMLYLKARIVSTSGVLSTNLLNV